MIVRSASCIRSAVDRWHHTAILPICPIWEPWSSMHLPARVSQNSLTFVSGANFGNSGCLTLKVFCVLRACQRSPYLWLQVPGLRFWNQVEEWGSWIQTSACWLQEAGSCDKAWRTTWHTAWHALLCIHISWLVCKCLYNSDTLSLSCMDYCRPIGTLAVCDPTHVLQSTTKFGEA